MKLTVTRKQDLSGYNAALVVAFALDVSDEEHQVLKKYGKLTDVVGQVPEICQGVKLTRLISEGARFRTRSLKDALAVEDQVKRDCQELANFVHGTGLYSDSYTLELVPTISAQGNSISSSSSSSAFEELVSLRQAQQYVLQELRAIRQRVGSLQTGFGILLLFALMVDLLNSCSRYRF